MVLRPWPVEHEELVSPASQVEHRQLHQLPVVASDEQLVGVSVRAVSMELHSSSTDSFMATRAALSLAEKNVSSFSL